MNDKEKNDIHDEVFRGANKTDISEIVHCVPSVTGNKDIEAKKCFNDRECNDSPVEGTVGGNQADIGRGGSSSVADQSMENDQPTKVLVIESQTLHGITIFEKGNMGLTLLKTDQGYLVIKSIEEKSPAELSGLRYGDVLCCPWTNSNNVTTWNTLISNMKNTENRPLYVEVWRQVNTDDVLRDLKKEDVHYHAGCEEAKLLRNVLSQQLKTISCPSIRLFNLTHHLMKNDPWNGNIPNVLTKLLQHVVFKMTDHGPNYSSIINGDNQRWKIQCSKMPQIHVRG